MLSVNSGLILLLCGLSPLLCGAYTVISPDTYMPRPIHCNAGQAYWCKNISTAVECRAVKHCIKAVWEEQVPIEKDTSSVCQTCIDMVKLARDQLESNETQSEIRQVLEGICYAVPVKHLREDCDKLMDDFGSYLVDTLASQMNPQVVCSVAGLCDNPAFHKSNVGRQLTCDSCMGLMKQVEDKIDTASADDLRTALVSICRDFGSYSDACSALVLQHLPELSIMISNDVKAFPVCSFAGVCTEKFHTHAKLLRVEVGDMKDVEVLGGAEDDDLPCELCEQLVQHLKDVMIANTTEAEFKQVLFGICEQMKSNFKAECHNLVANYYDIIYAFLTNELNGKVLCSQIGICPQAADILMRPLVPGELALPPSLQPSKSDQIPVYDPLTILPKALLGRPSLENQELCSFCEYFLHFVQQEITLPSSELKIREVVEKACTRLPASVSDQCNAFVETYISTFIALLANRIDPSQVCPGLGVCPGKLVFASYKDKPTCPLCLLAVDEILRKISNRTEEDINDAIDDLCIRDVFPNSLTMECAGFISKYRKSLTDMILAGFTSEEACLYSEVCHISEPVPGEVKAIKAIVVDYPDDSQKPPQIIYNSNNNNEISTDRKAEANVRTDVCVICEFAMTKLEKILKDKKTEEEIKESVYKVCNYMPHTVTAQCKEFVEDYAELIINLLSQEISPKEMCTALNLCAKANTLIAGVVRKCLACEVLMESLKTVVTDIDIDDGFNHKLTLACRRLPEKDIGMCLTIVHELAPQIEAAVRSLPIGPLICRRISLCGSHQCSLGPSFWCKSPDNAILCQEREFCRMNLEKQVIHGQSHLKGIHVV